MRDNVVRIDFSIPGARQRVARAFRMLGDRAFVYAMVVGFQAERIEEWLQSTGAGSPRGLRGAQPDVERAMPESTVKAIQRLLIENEESITEMCRALRGAGFPENLDADGVEAILQGFEVSLMEPEYHGLGELDAAWMAWMSQRAMGLSELGEVIVTELDAGGTLPWMVMKGPLLPDSGGEGRSAQNER